MELIGLREFARRKKVSVSTIKRCIKRGVRIQTEPETGKIDWEEWGDKFDSNRNFLKSNSDDMLAVRSQRDHDSEKRILDYYEELKSAE